MYRRGMVVGKFWPPHQGHLHLIDTAAAWCNELIVGVVYREHERPSVHQRVEWLKEIYRDLPHVNVLWIPNMDGKEEDSAAWARLALQIAERTFVAHASSGIPLINAVFTSEPYGDSWAAELRKLGQGTVHVLVDIDRVRNPVSGTEIRSNPTMYWDLIPPPVREYYARRFCIVGGESTGKSTLVPKLAKFFGGTYTDEAGRDFVEMYGADQENYAIWAYIMREQPAREALACRTSPNGFVFCDTDLLTTCVWYERWVGIDDFYESVLMPLAQKSARNYEHHFLLDHTDVPWIDDGTRSEQENREWFTTRLQELLEENSRPYTVVKGPFQTRSVEVARLIGQLTI